MSNTHIARGLKHKQGLICKGDNMSDHSYSEADKAAIYKVIAERAY